MGMMVVVGKMGAMAIMGIMGTMAVMGKMGHMPDQFQVFCISMHLPGSVKAQFQI